MFSKAINAINQGLMWILTQMSYMAMTSHVIVMVELISVGNAQSVFFLCEIICYSEKKCVMMLVDHTVLSPGP